MEKDDDTNETYWKYYPKYFSFTLEEYEELKRVQLLNSKPISYKIFNTTGYYPKLSYLYVNNVEDARKKAYSKAKFNYKETSMYTWSEAPKVIQDVKEILERDFGYNFDYVLVNLYRSRTDSIGFHNDEEAMQTDIASVSLGISRIFQLRPYHDKKGKYHKYILRTGDLFCMFGPSPGKGDVKGCQSMYKHEVPKMKIDDVVRVLRENKIELPKGRKTYKALDDIIEREKLDMTRINLTFRMFE